MNDTLYKIFHKKIIQGKIDKMILESNVSWIEDSISPFPEELKLQLKDLELFFIQHQIPMDLEKKKRIFQSVHIHKMRKKFQTFLLDAQNNEEN